MRRRASLVSVLLPVVLLSAACSDDGGPTADTATTGNTVPSNSTAVDMTGQCETGHWVSTGMTAPTQAGVGDITPTGGGDGMDISFGTDGVFQIDFGPMQPSTATFVSGGQEGVLSVSFSGVGKGIWTVDPTGQAVASFENFATAKALATLTLGQTVPPIFDDTLQNINDQRMLNGERVGVFTVTDCNATGLSMTTPFPGGTVEIIAAKA
jgi:hypothetical protein